MHAPLLVVVVVEAVGRSPDPPITHLAPVRLALPKLVQSSAQTAGGRGGGRVRRGELTHSERERADEHALHARPRARMHAPLLVVVVVEAAGRSPDPPITHLAPSRLA